MRLAAMLVGIAAELSEYFLLCRTRQNAALLTDPLNSKAATGFLRSLMFWDAKRPISAQVLVNLDLGLLAEETGVALPEWSANPQYLTLFST